MQSDIHMQPLLVEMAIEPKSKVEQEKLGVALMKLSTDDPSFQVSHDPESGQTIMRGTSEDQLDIKVETLKRTYKIDAIIGAPQVAFRERPTKRVEHEYTHKKQSGGSGQFAAVKLAVEPNEPGAGYVFKTKIAGIAVPKEYMPGIEKGIENVLTSGVLAGFPVVDVKVELIDGKYHDVDSSALAFEIASRRAFREALQKADPVLLEPMMKVVVMTPREHTKSVVDDLGLRRGQIKHNEISDNTATINATVPLMTMFGYGSALRLISGGRAIFTMQFDHYAPAAPPPEDHPPFRPAIGMRA